MKEIGRFNVQRTGSGGRGAEAAAIVDVLKLPETLGRLGSEQSHAGRPPSGFKSLLVWEDPHLGAELRSQGGEFMLSHQVPTKLIRTYSLHICND